MNRICFKILIFCLIISSCRDKVYEVEPVIGHWEYSNLGMLSGVVRENGLSFEIEDSLYVCLGKDSFGKGDNSLWRYTKNGRYVGWEKRAEFPGEPRIGAVAFTVGRWAYVGLGRSIDDPKEYYKDFWVFDAEANSWSPLKFEFPSDAVAYAVAFSKNGIGYVGTGEKSDGRYSGDFFKFDLRYGWKSMEYMVLPRAGASVFELNGIVYLCFGHNGKVGGGPYEYLRDFSKFDEIDFRFRTINPLLPDKYPGITRSYASSFVLEHNGQEYAYFVGGKLGNDVTEPYWFCCRYDYVKDIWEKVATMPRNNVSVTTWVDDNTAFVFWNDAVLKFVPDN